MLEQVLKVFRETLDVEEATVLEATMGPDEIEEWDSFGTMALFSALESEFGIKFSFEDMVSISSIGDIVKVVEEKKGC